ncbi:MAG: HAMP domain-containing histidine kinase [Clostridiales Family XIII bacterium]|jgi:signal transduction histidine kinase|nr:HAMP domain-containing histidine kinase [Clostridiales Family XIII bacterium]
MLKKLRNKLLLVNMISLSVVILFSFTIIYVLTYNYIQGVIVTDLRSIPPGVVTNAIVAEREQQPNIDGSSEKFNVKGIPDLPMDYSKSFVINIDKSGGVLAVFSRIELSENDYVKAARFAEESGEETGRIKLAGKRWQYIITGEQRESIVFLDVDDYERALSRLLFSMLVVGICVLILIFLVSYRLANRAIRPVGEDIEKQRRFVADASHELKTPLAIIDANAEVALADGDDGEESRRKWVERIEEESGRMRSLVEALLYLAKAEDAVGENLPFELSAAAEEEIGRVEAVLYERDVRLTLKKYAETVVVKADGEKIHRAILILLDNAVKYTDAGGEVTVETGKGKHTGYLRVSNTGAGIPPEDLPRIFDRFYRGDKSRTSAEAAANGGKQGGFGLGLAIAKTIVERSAGKIYAESADGRTTFTIELPLG